MKSFLAAKTLNYGKKAVAGSVMQRSSHWIPSLDVRKFCEESYFDEEDRRLFGVCVCQVDGSPRRHRKGMRGSSIGEELFFCPRGKMQAIAGDCSRSAGDMLV